MTDNGGTSAAQSWLGCVVCILVATVRPDWRYKQYRATFYRFQERRVCSIYLDISVVLMSDIRDIYYFAGIPDAVDTPSSHLSN